MGGAGGFPGQNAQGPVPPPFATTNQGTGASTWGGAGGMAGGGAPFPVGGAGANSQQFSPARATAAATAPEPAPPPPAPKLVRKPLAPEVEMNFLPSEIKACVFYAYSTDTHTHMLALAHTHTHMCTITRIHTRAHRQQCVLQVAKAASSRGCRASL